MRDCHKLFIVLIICLIIEGPKVTLIVCGACALAMSLVLIPIWLIALIATTLFTGSFKEAWTGLNPRAMFEALKE